MPAGTGASRGVMPFIAVAVLTASCAAHTPPLVVSELLGDRGGAFVMLLRHDTAQAKPGHADSASDAAELRMLWARWELPLAPPALDFTRDVVWLISVEGARHESVELEGLTLDSAGVVEPSIRFHLPRPPSAESRAWVFVLAIRRSALPQHVRLRLPAHFDVPALERALAGGTRGASAGGDLARAEPPPQAGAWLGSAPLPPLEGVASAALDDGAQVWIVRHADGEISVLASHEVLDELGARRFSGLRGLQLPLRFRADVRRFYGVGEYDEYGASTEGALRAPLPRHRHVVEGGRVHIGARDTAAPPAGIARGHGALEAGVEPQTLPVAPAAPLPLAQAAALPEGTRVVLDAALLVRDRELPRLCPAALPIDDCGAADGARVLDLEVVESTAQGRVFAIHGPLSARVARGGFVELRVPPSASYTSFALQGRAVAPQPAPCTSPRSAP